MGGVGAALAERAGHDDEPRGAAGVVVGCGGDSCTRARRGRTPARGDDGSACHSAQVPGSYARVRMARATHIVEVVDYEPSWPDRFHQRSTEIVSALNEPRARVEHIGSTAVPGLAAKPVIDVLVTMPTAAALDAAVPALESIGYAYTQRYEDVDVLGDEALASRRFLHLGEHAQRDVNVHVFLEGDPEAERHIAFRDWLREHPEDRDAYAALKRSLAKGSRTVDDYTVAKTAFVHDVEAKAAEERAQRSGRIVEWSAVVAASPLEVYELLRTPDGLRTWYPNAVETEAGGTELVMRFDEEYGYRRVTRCTVEHDQPGEGLTWHWRSQERTYDGQLVAQTPALQAGARWADANLDGALRARWRLLPEPGGGARVLLSEEGYGDDARWDHTLIERAAWWQYYLGARLPQAAGAGTGAGFDVEVGIGVAPTVVWRALLAPEEQARWLPDALRLPARAGATFVGYAAGGAVRGTVQTIQRPRRIRLSWAAPGALGTRVELAVTPGDEHCSTRLRLRHDAWPADGGPGQIMRRTARAWEQWLSQLARHLEEHPW